MQDRHTHPSNICCLSTLVLELLEVISESNFGLCLKVACLGRNSGLVKLAMLLYRMDLVFSRSPKRSSMMHFRSWHGDFMIEVDCRLRKDSGKSSRKFYTANRKMTDFERGIYWACWTSSAILLSIALLSRPRDSISVLVDCSPRLISTYPSDLRSSPCQSLIDGIISRYSIVGRVVDMLTVSCPDFWLDLQGFADQDRGVRVVLLHGRVLLGKERAVAGLSGYWLRMAIERSGKDGNLPDGSAVFRGLAVVEAQLLECLRE